MEHNFENCHNLTCKKKSQRIGYEQALKEINTPLRPIQEEWNPSKCPRCKGSFFDYEECDDGYYKRAYNLERCPLCGQKLEW